MALSLPSQTTEERAASDARARRQALRQVGRAAAGKVCASAGSVAGATIHVMDAPMRRIRQARWFATTGRAIFLPSLRRCGLRHSAEEGP
jgi:hypothetical protein